VSEAKIDWDDFCRSSHVRPVRFDDQARDTAAAQEEMLLQQCIRRLHGQSRAISGSMSACGIARSSTASLALAMMTARTLGEALQIACRWPGR